MITETEVAAHEALLLAAIKTNDVGALDSLLHEDLLFILPGGQTCTKADDLRNYASGNIQLESIIAADRQTSFFDEVAVVSVEISLKGKYLEHSLDGRFRYLRVWKRAEGGLKVIGGSCTPVS